MSLLVDFVKLIETYRGRDKIIRLCSYAAMFVGGQGNSPFSRKVRLFGSELSSCRVILRLFDDLPMLLHNIRFGFGKQERNPYVRFLDLISNLVNQLYYPVEHIAWWGDKKFISLESGKFWVAGIFLWAASLFLEILKCMFRIAKLRKSLTKLKRQKYLDREDYLESSEQKAHLATRMQGVQTEIRDQYLLVLQSTADLLNAGNWMPKGVLWSGRFSPTKCGFFGLVSSFIMLYRQLQSRS